MFWQDVFYYLLLHKVKKDFGEKIKIQLLPFVYYQLRLPFAVWAFRHFLTFDTFET